MKLIFLDCLKTVTHGEPSEIEFDLVSITRDDPAAYYGDVLDSDELEDFVLESYENQDYI